MFQKNSTLNVTATMADHIGNFVVFLQIFVSSFLLVHFAENL